MQDVPQRAFDLDVPPPREHANPLDQALDRQSAHRIEVGDAAAG
jgi:hypothetical protein